MNEHQIQVTRFMYIPLKFTEQKQQTHKYGNIIDTYIFLLISNRCMQIYAITFKLISQLLYLAIIRQI